MAQEFFYGLPQLRNLGLNVDFLETSDLHPEEQTLGFKWAAFKDRQRSKQLGMEHCERLFLDKAAQIDNYDVIIAGTEYVALGLVDRLRKYNRPPPLLFFVMGMLSKPIQKFDAHSLRQKFAVGRYGQLLKMSSHALFLGQGELRLAENLFPHMKNRFRFLPFGVDTSFWTPKYDGIGEYVLFVGNDRNRDLDLLKQIASAMPTQKFVAITTLLENTEVPSNLEIVAGNWKHEILSDADIRQYYQNAAAVILPIKDTYQPSGQSVALQAMACGRPVIISNFAGFWEPCAFENGRDILFADANSVSSFTDHISKLVSQPDLANQIGSRARQLVAQRYSIDQFADQLSTYSLEALA